MLISAAMNAKLNEQITHEMNASQKYLAIACTFDGLSLKRLARRFREQSDEERGHATKILDYVLDVGGNVTLQALAQPKGDYATVLAAIEAAVESELTVTRQINDLVDLAEKEKDHATRSFLQWFVDEQVEEVSSMSHLAQLARMAGNNLLQLEAAVAHSGDDKD
ncbi:MAG: ferritin [Phycisphaerae bacterium]|jgi:ferritin|nr:ferritin [Phycisphaerae bacterium]MCZ2400704.1 ferritin [Phycisphaerae bacterium]NUQ50439.1 ferritin [Phycisphaerae bacterium]